MSDPSQTLALPDDCNTLWACAFHDTQSTEPAPATTIVVNAEAVRRVNTPAVQVLLAFGRSIEARQGQFRIEGPSPALTEAFTDLGLDTTLAQWSTPSHG